MTVRRPIRFYAPLFAFGLAIAIAMIAKTVRPAAGGETSVSLDLTRPPSAARGATLFATSCAQCHGTSGRGMPRQGPSLRDSHFIAGQDDRRLIAFVRNGRTPDDAASVMKLYMPAKGGVASYSDNDLQDIVAHVRTLQPPTVVATR